MFPPTQTRTELAAPIALIVWAWNAAIARVLFARSLPAPRAALLDFAHHWLNRTVVRFDNLVQRWQAGTLPKPRPNRAANTQAPTPAPEPGQTPPGKTPPSKTPKLRLPSGHRWLVALAPTTLQHHERLSALLANPDTIRLLQAAPQAGRLLRPLCRAIGLEIPAYMALPPRPERPRKPRPPQSSQARPPRPKLPPMRPLPAYVRAAVRAWKPRYG